jgi:fumarylacetoacetate (FAA) hydrolase
MKLASLKGGRDGRLVVVSDDLAYFAYAGHISTTLQDVLDNWDMLAPKLELLAIDLAHAAIPRERFHERDAASPLPRAFGWIVNETLAASDRFLGPRDALTLTHPAGLIDSGIVVVTGDVAVGASAEEAQDQIRLIGLSATHDTSCLRHTATCFSPVFVTPDTLGNRWARGRFHGSLCVDVNGKPASRVEPDNLDFGEILAEAVKHRALGAGTLIGVSLAAVDAPSPSSGDCVRIWMDDDKHHPIFGVIEQAIG